MYIVICIGIFFVGFILGAVRERTLNSPDNSGTTYKNRPCRRCNNPRCNEFYCLEHDTEIN